jgi:hypothetical protein
MLHSALARALATARIEDQVRAADRWRNIRLARPVRATGGVTVPIRRRRRLGSRAGIHRASSKARTASSHTRTSRGSE